MFLDPFSLCLLIGELLICKVVIIEMCINCGHRVKNLSLKKKFPILMFYFQKKKERNGFHQNLLFQTCKRMKRQLVERGKYLKMDHQELIYGT